MHCASCGFPTAASACGELVDELGTARVVWEGSDATIVALAMMVPRALEAAERLAKAGVSAEVIDVRSLVLLVASVEAGEGG